MYYDLKSDIFAILSIIYKNIYNIINTIYYYHLCLLLFTIKLCNLLFMEKQKQSYNSVEYLKELDD